MYAIRSYYVFDTRLAAGFASLPSTLSLANLIHELLDISLPKTETRTNWLQRPLEEKQVERNNFV